MNHKYMSENKERLDKYIKKNILNQVSRTYITNRIKDGTILINGEVKKTWLWTSNRRSNIYRRSKTYCFRC